MTEKAQHGPLWALVEVGIEAAKEYMLAMYARDNVPEAEIKEYLSRLTNVRAAADALDAESSWEPPVNAELSELTMLELVDRAYVAGMETERAGESYRSDVSRGQDLLNEARRRDPTDDEVDDAIAAAFAASAQRNTRPVVAWPQGDAAAEQLARAWHQADMQMDDEHAGWEDLTPWWQFRYRTLAAAVLRALQEGGGESE